MDFQIKEDFLIDGQPVKLISGAVHYFRSLPEKWEHILYNLKAMGCNTVETYVPWNLHEPKRGEFNFTGHADIEAFLSLAQEMGLYIILRPSPYICAEWDFGGLPAWLLKDKNMRIRSRQPEFLTAVASYYAELLPRVTKFQYTQGGKLLMVQVENEYGSYSEDTNYLRALAKMIQENGIDVPLFTSDGGWKQVLDAGTLSEDGILATANFGSDADTNFTALKKHNEKFGLKHPYMCMEFWDGWFNNWEEPIIKRDPEETANEVRQVLKWGSINFYMFHGGTNFGFYNGCSDMGQRDVPQITSYDYDAPLNEYGAPTEKFFAIQRAIKESCPEVEIFEPKYPTLTNLGEHSVTEKVSLFATLDKLAQKKVNDYPLNMEALDQSFGYTLYRSTLKEARTIDNLRVIDASDRVQMFINEQLVATQQYETIGQPVAVTLDKTENQLDILVENTARNNYGPKLVAHTQFKGIRRGVMEDIHYISNWEHYCLELESIESVDFSKEWVANTPAFYKFEAVIEQAADTFIDCSGWGKGVVFVNGFNIGRFWENGPAVSLYVPSPLLKAGVNEIVVFETEGRDLQTLSFVDHPVFKQVASHE
ncbi:glycoside hydrolase family 35 protein [Enterococcus lemanii]|uniref:Beta-galactosidase family protein n=1 Tax=Enterococcus lemanii TaxID=1159752 RepID=A0ABV9N064_9ENTE|nr:beta-galactosidase family protein [Enterococcus lemanii]MBM7708211.1 beta-galactosidase [Enterococcus lemanii]